MHGLVVDPDRIDYDHLYEYEGYGVIVWSDSMDFTIYGPNGQPVGTMFRPTSRLVNRDHWETYDVTGRCVTQTNTPRVGFNRFVRLHIRNQELGK